MKKIFKAFIAVMAFLGTAFGALLIFDKIANKNRIKGDYLECEAEDADPDYPDSPDDPQ